MCIKNTYRKNKLLHRILINIKLSYSLGSKWWRNGNVKDLKYNTSQSLIHDLVIGNLKFYDAGEMFAKMQIDTTVIIILN